MRTLVTGVVAVSEYEDGRVRVDARRGLLQEFCAGDPRGARAKLLAMIAAGCGLDDDDARTAAWAALRML